MATSLMLYQRKVTPDVAPEETLSWTIRQDAGSTGSKYGLG
jgi:aerobic-type carbon monoxide dehydrogenase small subunit (CoxS/CutS family)